MAAAFKEATKELKPKERKAKLKQDKEDRQTVATRQALLARHKYVVSRVHYRYDDKSLPNDPEFGPASGAIEGGVAQPKGQKAEASSDVLPAERFEGGRCPAQRAEGRSFERRACPPARTSFRFAVQQLSPLGAGDSVSEPRTLPLVARRRVTIAACARPGLPRI